MALKDLLKDIDQVAPAEFDAEDQAFGNWQPSRAGRGHADGEPDDPSATAHYVPVEKSSLRKQASAQDDPKYAGRKVSRAQMFDARSQGSDESAAELSGQDDSGSPEPETPTIQDQEDEEDENLPFGEVQDESSSAEEEHDEDGLAEQPQPSTSGSQKRKAVSFAPEQQNSQQEEAEEPRDEHKEESEDLVRSLRKAATADVEKGQHVRKQLTFYDTLLEMRIKMQKPLGLINTLPSPEVFDEYHCDEVDQAKVSLANLIEDISSLRSELASKNDTYSAPTSKRRKIDTTEDIPALSEHLSSISDFHTAAEPFLESTIRKWSDKVNAASTAAIRNKSKFNNNSNSAIFKDTWSQIQGALQADQGRLVDRTKTLRSGAEAIGGGEPTTVFDDSDFYQQLLKDLVDHQMLDPDDSSIKALQLAAQAKKPKKHVDTKASKGRKLRYHVHEKLQNFMVPIQTVSWSEAQTDELFRSLLGKGFEGYLQDGVEAEDEAEAADGGADGEGLEGLRIFG